MKNFVVIFLLAASLQASARIHIPDAVTKAFHTQFPAISSVKWEVENGNYEANFKEKGQETSAVFDKNGSLLETEHVIAVKALPAGVSAYIAKNFHGAKVEDAAIIKSAAGETTYEAHLKGADYIFDESGKLLKTEKK